MLETVTPTHDAKAAHNLIQEYFDAWKGTDEQKILDWYSDDVKLRLPTGVLEGKAAVRDRFVRPFITAFPGNIHEIQRLIYEGGLVAVEWRFKAEHSGEFQGIPPSGAPYGRTGLFILFPGRRSHYGGQYLLQPPDAVRADRCLGLGGYAAMSGCATEHDAIIKLIELYIDGCKEGKSELMRGAFHSDASFFGYAGEDLAQGLPFLFDWIDKNGPAPDIQPRLAGIDILDSIAVVRLEVENWSGKLAGSGVHMSDLFTLLKTSQGWKIIQKAFHWHS